MENKKVNKKLSSYFWYILYSFPLICFFIGYIGYLLIFKGSGILPDNNFISSFVIEFNSMFSRSLFPFIHNALIRICDILGNSMIDEFGSLILIILTWFIQMMLLHIIVDVLTFIFNLYHKLMEKVV